MTEIIQVNKNELRELLREFYNEIQSEAEAAAVEKAKDSLLTIDEVAQRLGVSRPTLWRWEKANHLVPVRVCGQKRYRNSDVRKLMQEG